MNLIHKKNFIPIICMTYTIVSISLTIFEILDRREMTPSHLNIFLFLACSILGVGVLALHRFLDRFSPLVMLLLQYLIAIVIIHGTLWMASYFVDIHPDGFHDMLLSFTVPYAIGCVIYYFCLKIEVKKQNDLLKQMKQKHLQDS